MMSFWGTCCPKTPASGEEASWSRCTDSPEAVKQTKNPQSSCKFTGDELVQELVITSISRHNSQAAVCPANSVHLGSVQTRRKLQYTRPYVLYSLCDLLRPD